MICALSRACLKLVELNSTKHTLFVAGVVLGTVCKQTMTFQIRMVYVFVGLAVPQQQSLGASAPGAFTLQAPPAKRTS